MLDENGNKIVVPAGFKIVSDDTTNNAQTVEKGIVVEDERKINISGFISKEIIKGGALLWEK